MDFNKDLLPVPCGETGRKECPPVVEFPELEKGGGDGNMGTVILGKE